MHDECTPSLPCSPYTCYGEFGCYIHIDYALSSSRTLSLLHVGPLGRRLCLVDACPMDQREIVNCKHNTHTHNQRWNTPYETRNARKRTHTQAHRNSRDMTAPYFLLGACRGIQIHSFRNMCVCVCVVIYTTVQIQRTCNAVQNTHTHTQIACLDVCHCARSTSEMCAFFVVLFGSTHTHTANTHIHTHEHIRTGVLLITLDHTHTHTHTLIGFHWSLAV